ncbi:hypothetical protein AB2762_04785 [Acinetobacter indicus]
MEATSIITGYTVRIKPNLNPQLIQAWDGIMVEGNKAQAVIKELRLDPAIQTLHRRMANRITGRNPVTIR